MQSLRNALYRSAGRVAPSWTTRSGLMPVWVRSWTTAGARSFGSTEKVMSDFLGAQSAFTTDLNIATEWEPLECFRRTSEDGNIIEDDYEPSLTDEQLVEMYRTMTRLNVLDQIFYDSQRQGRISFYMTNFGEESLQLGSSAALDDEDLIFAQYREAGVLLWRGFPLQSVAHQCFNNEFDLGKGRQMPVHYGSRELHFQTISSPLSTQIPQAAGAAYAYKLEGKKNVVVCYFGEGAASEGDFHTAMNFASTLECPVVFVCRNNGYAISTPTTDQYRGDGIGARGPGYGMATIRVDGNCIFAVYDAMTEARNLALSENRPVLVEAMTYRAGHHSTSDDSSRYRSVDEIKEWQTENSPLIRVRQYLESKGEWDNEQEAELRVETRKEVLTALNNAEKARKPPLDEMFTDVYDDVPKNLLEQREQMRAHMEKYSEQYGNTFNVYQDPEEYEEPPFSHTLDKDE